MDPRNTSRSEQFAADVDRVVEHGLSNRDERLARVGAWLLAAGTAIGVVAYSVAHRTTSSFTQGDAIVIVGVGVSVSIAGAALYLRHGLAGYLRIWLARFVYENARDRAGRDEGNE